MSRQADMLRVVDNPGEQRFEGYLGDVLAGVAAYIPLEGKVIVTHTEVGEAFAGQGVGSNLVGGMVDLLRAEGRLLQPLCPYVAGWLRRHPDQADVVDPTTPR